MAGASSWEINRQHQAAAVLVAGCWLVAALPSPPGSHLELEHRLGLGLCLIQLHGGNPSVTMCGSKQVPVVPLSTAASVGGCEHAPVCPGHYVTLKPESGRSV